MTFQHKTLAHGRWRDYSLPEQLANIGSEIFRTIQWRNRGNEGYAKLAFERALELFDLTLQDTKNRDRLKEVARARELAVDYFFGCNLYQSSDEFWQKYFLAFNYLARQGR